MPTESAKRESEEARKDSEKKPVAVQSDGDTEELKPGERHDATTEAGQQQPPHREGQNPPTGS